MSFSLSNQPLKSVTVIGGILWALMIMCVVGALSFEDRFFALGGKPIAFLKQSQRDVTFRREDDVKWRPVASDQGFFDGDRVATGPSSDAVVDFGEGRQGLLGPETIVAISSIKQPGGTSFILNLVKGGIKPIVPPNAKNQLIVTSGVNTFYVEPGQSRGFSKPVGGVIREFSSKEKFPAPTRQPAATVVKYTVPANLGEKLAFLPSVAVVPVALASPEAEIAPKQVEPAIVPVAEPPPVEVKKVERPRVSLTGQYPAIDSASLPSAYYSAASLKSLSGKVVVAKIVPPSRRADGWVGGIEMDLGGKKTVFPADSSNKVQIRIPSGDILAGAAKEKLGAIPCASLNLRPYAKLGKNGSEDASGSGSTSTKLNICSLLDAKFSMPLMISLNALAAPNSDDGLFTTPMSASAYPIKMVITRADDYLKLIPYLRGSTIFKVQPAPAFSASGIFGVLDGKIAMQLAGDDIKPKLANALMELFGHTFVFKGSRNAVYNASGMDAEKFKSWISENTDAGKTVYVRVKGGLVPVSRDFMNERQEVADFIQRASGTLFLERVEIISYK